MNTIFEDRSGYTPDRDPVAVITLDVECAPGQVDSITNFLAAVSTQAGVYSAAVSCEVHVPQVVLEPEPAAPVVEEVVEEVVPEAVPVEAPQPVELPPDVLPADPKSEGEVDAEPELQQASEPAEASPVERSEAAPVVGEDAGHEGGVDGELAGPAGEGVAGSVGGSA